MQSGAIRGSRDEIPGPGDPYKCQTPSAFTNSHFSENIEPTLRLLAGYSAESEETPQLTDGQIKPLLKINAKKVATATSQTSAENTHQDRKSARLRGSHKLESLTGKLAEDVFREAMARGGTLPHLSASDGTRGRLIMAWFGASKVN